MVQENDSVSIVFKTPSDIPIVFVCNADFTYSGTLSTYLRAEYSGGSPLNILNRNFNKSDTSGIIAVQNPVFSYDGDMIAHMIYGNNSEPKPLIPEEEFVLCTDCTHHFKIVSTAKENAINILMSFEIDPDYI